MKDHVDQQAKERDHLTFVEGGVHYKLVQSNL